MKKNKITDDDIIMMARQLKEESNLQLMEEDMANTRKPNVFHASNSGKRIGGWWIAAASILGFLAGFGLRPSADSKGDVVAQTVVEHHTDTIVVHETQRDTVWQTRTIVKTAEPKYIAKQDAEVDKQEDEEESQGCSITCDNIPYDLLARN
ncbi:MAG: hypothetical protein IJK49_10145 [Prevotella sp.]|nr:hypothetical protein [Prevotella sp.]